MKPTKKGPWDKRQVKAFVAEVWRDVGDGWAYLGKPVRRALIAERAFCVCRSQARESVDVDAMDWLLFAMLDAAGLGDEA